MRCTQAKDSILGTNKIVFLGTTARFVSRGLTYATFSTFFDDRTVYSR